MAAERGFPIQGLIGDLQYRPSTHSLAYDSNSISCEINFCNVNCRMPDSPLIAYGYNDTQKNHDTRVQVVEDLSSGMLYFNRKVSSTITLMTNTGRISNVKLTKPNCELNVLLTLGCRECSENPSIIIKSTQLIVSGIIRIKSNCTLIPNYLTCQQDPYQISVTGNPEICFIEYMNNKSPVSKNLTIHIHYDLATPLYQLTSLSYSTSANINPDIGSIFSSSNFYTGVMAAIGTFASITVIFRSLIAISSFLMAKNLLCKK